MPIPSPGAGGSPGRGIFYQAPSLACQVTAGGNNLLEGIQQFLLPPQTQPAFFWRQNMLQTNRVQGT